MSAIIEVPKAVVREAMEDNITGEAAKAAYYFFFALFPLILVAFALTGIVGGDRAFDWMMERLQTLVPDEGENVLAGFLTEITGQQRPGLLSFGILATIWAASNFFAALGDGLDSMYDVREPAGFLRRRLKALGMLAMGAVLGIGGVVAIMAGPALVQGFGLQPGTELVRWPLGFLLIVMLMWLIYYILPSRDQSDSKREIAIAAVAATIVWMVATAGFHFYVYNLGDFGATYGGVGAVIVLMLWLYLTALAVLLGGEIAHVLERRRIGEDEWQARSRGERPNQARDDEHSDETPRRARYRTRADGAISSGRRPDHGNDYGRNDGRAAVRQPADPADSRGMALAPSEGSGAGQRTAWRNRMADDMNRPTGSEPFAGRGSAAGERGYTGGFSGSGNLESGEGTTRERAGEAGHRAENLVEQGKERAEHALEQGKERVETAARSGKNRIAGKLDEFGNTIEERGREMQERGGVQARAGNVAQRAGTALEDGAEYLREHEFNEMRDDLERQIRSRPIASVGIALAAGFFIARILR
jgi:membrane protein